MGLKPALFWFAIIAVLAIVWKLLDLPSDAELVSIVREWLEKYGLLIILFGSLIETILFVGFYFPGSVIIFLGVGLAPDPLSALLAVLAVSAGMLCGYTVNYILGKYGWYKIFLKLGMKNGIENARMKMQKNEIRYIFYTYWNPGLAAFTSTAAGILRLPFKRFLVLMVLAILLWNTFWGVIVYSLGESALALLDFKLVLKVIAVWILFEIGLLIWKKYFKRSPSSV
jgi:membrane protein DedA with SNARE-associated domain